MQRGYLLRLMDNMTILDELYNLLLDLIIGLPVLLIVGVELIGCFSFLSCLLDNLINFLFVHLTAVQLLNRHVDACIVLK